MRSITIQQWAYGQKARLWRKHNVWPAVRDWIDSSLSGPVEVKKHTFRGLSLFLLLTLLLPPRFGFHFVLLQSQVSLVMSYAIRTDTLYRYHTLLHLGYSIIQNTARQSLFMNGASNEPSRAGACWASWQHIVTSCMHDVTHALASFLARRNSISGVTTTPSSAPIGMSQIGQRFKTRPYVVGERATSVACGESAQSFLGI